MQRGTSMANCNRSRLKSNRNIISHPATQSLTYKFKKKGQPNSPREIIPYSIPPHIGLTVSPQRYNWNVDNMGPIIVPKKGWTVTLDSLTLPIYERAIAVYEHNRLEVKNDELYINGKPTPAYTFKMDYYWMLGDNWYDSEDSRFWGFLPEDHVIGQALFTW